MPILNFNTKAAGYHQQQLIDITRNRSTESTVDATGAAKQEPTLTPPTSPGSQPAQLGSWRTKEMSSIVRPRSLAAVNTQEQEEMWTLKRSFAFDEDD